MDDAIKIISMVATFIGGLAQAYMSAQEIHEWNTERKKEKNQSTTENTTSQIKEA